MKKILNYPKTIVASILAMLVCLAALAGVHQTKQVGDISALSITAGSSDNFNFVFTCFDNSGTNWMGINATNTANPCLVWATNNVPSMGLTTNYTVATNRVLVIRGGIVVGIQ